MTAGKPVTERALGATQCKVRPEGKEVAARVNIPVNFYTLMAKNGSLKFNSALNQKVKYSVSLKDIFSNIKEKLSLGTSLFMDL